MGERLVLIVNPTATRTTPALRERIVETLRPFGLTGVLTTERGGHAAELASGAAAAGASIVAVLGGDGTVNEAADALAGSGAALIPLAGGSTNVFARAVGWPHPAAAALDVLEDTLRVPQRRALTLGQLTVGDTSRVFCVNVGVGVDGDTVRRVEQRPWLKHRLRQLGFGLAATAAAVHAARHPVALALRADAEPPVVLASAIVAVGSPYAYLGPRPLDLAPGAEFDGRLRWFGLERGGPLAVAPTVVRVLRGGERHLGRRGVHDGWAERQIVIDAGTPAVVQADGELIGWHRHVVIRPGPVLTLIAPAGR